MCLAQGHNAVTPVRLEPAAPRSQVNSTTEPLRSHTTASKSLSGTDITPLPMGPVGLTYCNYWALQDTYMHNLDSCSSHLHTRYSFFHYSWCYIYTVRRIHHRSHPQNQSCYSHTLKSESIYYLAEWNFPLISIGPVHFHLKGCRVVYFYSNFNRTFCKQTVETLIRCRILQHLIWVFTVCLCPTKRMLGLYGLNLRNTIHMGS